MISCPSRFCVFISSIHVFSAIFFGVLQNSFRSPTRCWLHFPLDLLTWSCKLRLLEFFFLLPSSFFAFLFSFCYRAFLFTIALCMKFSLWKVDYIYFLLLNTQDFSFSPTNYLHPSCVTKTMFLCLLNIKPRNKIYLPVLL